MKQKILLFFLLVVCVSSQSLFTRFINYAKIDSGSDVESPSTPSSDGQWLMLRLLEQEMHDLGITDVRLTPTGYLYVRITPSSPRAALAPPLLISAHVDTAPDVPTGPVSPRTALVTGRVQRHGLRLDNGRVITPDDLVDFGGQVAVTSDGSTLLGVDDKAGVAAMTELVFRLVTGRSSALVNDTCTQDGELGDYVKDLVALEASHAIIPSEWPEIHLMFTPDEELARGLPGFDPSDLLDLEWPVKHGFTIDGSILGRYSDETFSARMVDVTFTGYNKHTGYASEAPKLRSAVAAAAGLAVEVRDRFRAPEQASGREGFVHLLSMTNCTVDSCHVRFAVRDFNTEKVDDISNQLVYIARRFGDDFEVKTDAKVVYQYDNMLDVIQKSPELRLVAERAYHRAHAGWELVPVRGGTDGAKLAEYGIACSNTYVAGRNFHSQTEITTIEGLYSVANATAAFVEEWVQEWASKSDE